MAHAPKDLAAFQNGEVRIIYARRRDNDALYLLPDGEAAERKAWAREQLRCPIPECSNPELTTVSRSTRRDGFMHRTAGAGGHAPERLFHIQAAEMIAQWLRAMYPQSTVRKEEASNGRRERVADVMITAGPGRLAFEIQYSDITVQKWSERHESYATQGIPDVWLLGHAGEHMRLRSGEVQLGAVHELVATSSLVLWVNPITEQIATVVSPELLPGNKTVLIPVRRGRGQLLIVPLAEFGLTDSRFTCPRFDQLLVDEELVQSEWRAAEARQEAESAKRARARAEATALRRQEGNGDEEQKRERRRSFAQQQNDWLASADRSALLARLGGTWPPFIGLEIDGGLPVPTELWQATVFRDLILGKTAGTRVLIKDSLQLIGVSSHEEHVRVFRRWLAVLARQGVLEIKADRVDGMVNGVQYLVADGSWSDAERTA